MVFVKSTVIVSQNRSIVLGDQRESPDNAQFFFLRAKLGPNEVPLPVRSIDLTFCAKRDARDSHLDLYPWNFNSVMENGYRILLCDPASEPRRAGNILVIFSVESISSHRHSRSLGARSSRCTRPPGRLAIRDSRERESESERERDTKRKRGPLTSRFRFYDSTVTARVLPQAPRFFGPRRAAREQES